MLTPEHYSITPSEFVWLIHHAAHVFTDSFHGTVFSLIYEKQATVFERVQEGANRMFGRIRDLVSVLGMEQVLYGNVAFSRDKRGFKLSREAKAYLDGEREKAYQFLKENLIVQR